MESGAQTYWRKCSTCKKPIGLGADYYVCSVSTCNGQRTGYVFCGMQCFETHLPAARHRDAAAVEKTAPTTPHQLGEVSGGAVPSKASVAAASAPAERGPNRVFASQGSGALKREVSLAAGTPKEVLVIASRLKDYIAARSEFNTSQSVMDVLSDHLRVVCERAIDNARADGRRTVMDRDFTFLK